MSCQDREIVSLAIKSIEKAVGRIVERRSVDKEACRQIQHLIDHTGHLLGQLYDKRESLRALIGWFRGEWKRLEPQLAESSIVILQHAMENMLRMSDGLVMLTSGECRHPFDIEQARKTKFRSRLSTVKERKDGYTCLYKADAVYSGFGWDEFTNESVGIQHRLLALLKPYMKSPWDYLERKGATQLLETCLDQQELAVKELQHEVQDLKKTLLQDIRIRLKPTKLNFATQDKTERLLVVFENQTISLERRASNFQIEKGSVLPNYFKRTGDWAGHSLQMAAKQSGVALHRSRKRRLIINDSDSDEDSKPGQVSRVSNKVQLTTGLKVRVETSKPKEETEESLVTIKHQMGVDGRSLEASREELEQENEKIKKVVDCKEERTKRLKRILDRVVSRQFVDDNEVWDARECLRQANMELGNELLWSTRNFEKALGSFNEAKALVRQQQTSHSQVSQSMNDDTCESRYIQRNLLFLLAQATVNAGICLVEWAQKENKGVIRRKASQAITEFRSVQELAVNIRQRAEADKQQSRVHSSDWNDTAEDSLRADQLESLACRWMGLSMWLSSQEAEAISVFEHASSFFKSNANPRKDLFPAILEVAAECVYATLTLTDLVCSAMENLHRQAKEKGDRLLCVVERALRRHADIVGRLEQLALEEVTKSIFLDFLKDNDIARSNDVLENLDGIKRWWQKKRTQTAIAAAAQFVPRLSSNLPSPEISAADLDKKRFPVPTAHIILSEGRRRRKRKPSGGRSRFEDSYSQGAVRALQQEGNFDTNSQPLRFRKWGDELLPRTELPLKPGVTVPKMPYPSVAPPMPDDIRAYIEASTG